MKPLKPTFAFDMKKQKSDLHDMGKPKRWAINVKPIVDVRFLAWPIARHVDDRADRVKEWRMRRYELEDGSLIHVA